jgi:hypothetical protein
MIAFEDPDEATSDEQIQKDIELARFTMKAILVLSVCGICLMVAGAGYWLIVWLGGVSNQQDQSP